MKIELTLSEIKSLVTNHFNLPSDTEVVVVNDPLVSNNIQICLNEVSNFLIVNRKIDAIVRLRKDNPFKLSEAKWAIENWDAFKKWVFQNGRWPTFVGEYKNYSME